jgi:hypothetical protein
VTELRLSAISSQILNVLRLQVVSRLPRRECACCTEKVVMSKRISTMHMAYECLSAHRMSAGLALQHVDCGESCRLRSRVKWVKSARGKEMRG